MCARVCVCVCVWKELEKQMGEWHWHYKMVYKNILMICHGHEMSGRKSWMNVERWICGFNSYLFPFSTSQVDIFQTFLSIYSFFTIITWQWCPSFLHFLFILLLLIFRCAKLEMLQLYIHNTTKYGNILFKQANQSNSTTRMWWWSQCLHSHQL